MKHDAAWHERRRAGIGGSDVGAIFNLDYGCRKATWYEKRNVRPDYPVDEESPAMRRGTLLEPIVISEYEEATGRKVSREARARQSQETTFARCEVDGWIDEPDYGIGVLECKVLGRESFRRQTKGGLLESYVLQLQHGMYVSGTRWGSFAILCPDPWTLAHFDVDRDNDLIIGMLAEEESFWKQVTDGPAPEPLEDPKDKRCRECPWRRQCRGEAVFNILPEEEQSKEIELDPTLEQVALEYTEAKELHAEAEAYKEDRAAALKTALAGRNAVDSGSVRVYHRPHNVSRWDEKALSAKAKQDALFRELLGKYKKNSTQQPLLTYKV